MDTGTSIVVNFGGGGGTEMGTLAAFKQWLSLQDDRSRQGILSVTMITESWGLEDARVGFYEFADRPGASVQNSGSTMIITVSYAPDLEPVYNAACEVYSPQYSEHDQADADDIVAAGRAADTAVAPRTGPRDAVPTPRA